MEEPVSSPLMAAARALANGGIADARQPPNDSPQSYGDVPASHANAGGAVAAINTVDASLLADAVPVPASAAPDQPAISAVTADSSIMIPTDISEGITFGPADLGPAISVGLPFANQASTATSAAAGSVVYDNNNGSSTVPVARADGGVQINTVIGSAVAPTRYDYTFELPAGALVTAAGETVLITQGEKLLGGLAPAWAKDANGHDVPTHYEVKGTTITQVVEHDSSFAYPIVADPWIGVHLFSRITVDSYNSQPRVNLDLSTWGWGVYSGIAQGGGVAGIAAGQAILNTAGWDEAWGRGGTIRSALNKPSQRQQFSCHALGAVGAGTWNLEKFRPNRVNGDWGFGVAIHRCNWTTANRY